MHGIKNRILGSKYFAMNRLPISPSSCSKPEGHHHALLPGGLPTWGLHPAKHTVTFQEAQGLARSGVASQGTSREENPGNASPKPLKELSTVSQEPTALGARRACGAASVWPHLQAANSRFAGLTKGSHLQVPDTNRGPFFFKCGFTLSTFAKRG